MIPQFKIILNGQVQELPQFIFKESVCLELDVLYTGCISQIHFFKKKYHVF